MPIEGECHDKKGVPIYSGDLLKSLHFIDCRRRKHYLYHVAVSDGTRLWMVPTSHLDPRKVKGGGKCLLTQAIAAQLEIISGYGPGDYLDHTDRPRYKEHKE